MPLTLVDLARHLQLDPETIPGDDEIELWRFHDAAVRIIEALPDLREDAKPVDTDDPLMAFVVLELVRDMNSGTQSGGGGRAFGQDYAPDAAPMSTAGRPTLPPYVWGLLQPFLKTKSGPVGSFPPAMAWPAW